MANFSWAAFIEQEREQEPERAPAAIPKEESEIVRLLLSHRILTEQQVYRAQLEWNGDTPSFVKWLISRGTVTDEQVTGARARQLGIPAWCEPPQPEAESKVPANLCRTHLVLPVKIQNGLITLAMANPQNMGAIEAVRNFTKMRVEPALASESWLRKEIERAYGAKALQQSFDGLVKKAQQDFNAQGGRKDRATLTEADTRPVVGLVNHILSWAIRMGASDVHIEPRSESVSVRFRIDGELQTVQQIPLGLLPMLSTRLKIMAELDIVETRLPQDGRMSVIVDERSVDIRISVLPNHHGTRMVLRILDKSAGIKKLSEIGLSKQEYGVFRRMLQRPYGMLLVTGPTGSGKTTTLYAAIQELNREGRNIMTCEDPVEYEIEGVSQSQVNEKIGMSFPVQLRATLRQDPDVILVGEIRDRETAETAIRAALTGHLVLSTLHCNDAPGALPRLLDMGVDPYLLSTCLIGVTAQRLVRTLCPICKQPDPDGEDREALSVALGSEAAAIPMRAVGCEECFGAGFRGRAAVHEIMPVTTEIADMIATQSPIGKIQESALRVGYEPLQVEAMRRVIEGDTTLREAMRLIAFDSLVA